MSSALFRLFPQYQESIPYLPLIEKPTEVARLEKISKVFGHKELYIKREDQTDSIYGGNKVRNLEFVLGEAKHRKAKKVLTMAPLGSNFIAALAAQTKKVSLSAEVEHFVMVKTPQILAHADFSLELGAKLNVHPGYSGMLVAASQIAYSRMTDDETYYCPPGASYTTGALGHVSAALEFVEQINRGEVPKPDFIAVGAGTCGTIAGLTAGFKLAEVDIRVIGVRCVDAIVCNKIAVARLANSLLKKLGSEHIVYPHEITLFTSPLDKGYASPLQKAEELIQLFLTEENIELDTTYTSKVVAKLEELITEGHFIGRKVLYWHTFSPAAMQLTKQRASQKALDAKEVFI